MECNWFPWHPPPGGGRKNQAETNPEMNPKQTTPEGAGPKPKKTETIYGKALTPISGWPERTDFRALSGTGPEKAFEKGRAVLRLSILMAP